MKNRLSVEPTLFFKIFLLFFFSFTVGSTSLLAADMEEARRIEKAAREQAASFLLPDWAHQLPDLKTPDAQAMQNEAMKLVSKSSEKVASGSNRELLQQRELYYQNKAFVFASRSLGTDGLRQMLSSASSDNSNTTVVFRGIPKDMNLGVAMLDIQNIAREFDPVPNIIIDPTLFQKYKIHSVPTVVLVPNTGIGEAFDKSASSKAPELARVVGLSDGKWLTSQLEAGNTGNHGVRGPIKSISEPDFIEEAKRRMTLIDWDKKKDQAIKRFWHHQNFIDLPRATEDRIKMIDPSVRITADIKTPDGTVIARKGEVINPLDRKDFSQILVVFNPSDKQQTELLKQIVPSMKKQTGVNRVTYIITHLETAEDGWDAYAKLTKILQAPAYLLTEDVRNRFAIEKVPSVVTAKDRRFFVREITTVIKNNQGAASVEAAP